jgi:hypothetical protein
MAKLHFFPTCHILSGALKGTAFGSGRSAQTGPGGEYLVSFSYEETALKCVPLCDALLTFEIPVML